MNSTVFDTIEVLKAWAEQQQLRERAVASCRVALASCAHDDESIGELPLRGWPIDQIQLHFERHAFIFSHARLSYPYVDTRIGLYVADVSGFYLHNLRPIGHYRLIMLLSGEVGDDYLVIEDTP